ncbi:MAG: HAMP domain-containing histidine kinase [Planctomycetes bacterium]|nr:HAMP domain-containing histidine kinase [Planctomycetota bacterium]
MLHSANPVTPQRDWLSWLAAHRSLVAVYLAFALSMLGIVVIAYWNARLDFNETRRDLLQSEVSRLRSHAVRTALRIQESLTREGRPDDLTALDATIWLRPYWGRVIDGDEAHLYAAVVDQSGRVIKHSVAALEGSVLPSNWYLYQIPEAGDDVVETAAASLTGGPRALDIRVPLLHDNREIGAYHTGLDQAWFEATLGERRSAMRWRWAITTLLIFGVVVLAVFSAVSISKRFATLNTSLAMGRVRQMAELGQVAGGIAHEVRNPLNTIRLNLHYLERLWQNGQPSPDQSAQIMHETVDEIERVDAMMRSLVEYARPEKAHAEVLDLVVETQVVIDIMRPLLDRDAVNVEPRLEAGPLKVLMDRSRLRQAFLNLLTNSAEATGPQGHIRVSVRRAEDAAELAVADNGPGVPIASRERIFEPFHSTKELGTGLGLALVKRFVEEAGGSVGCHAAPEGGAEFRIRLPLVPQAAGARSAANGNAAARNPSMASHPG